jgi:hypothetical protein
VSVNPQFLNNLPTSSPTVRYVWVRPPVDIASNQARRAVFWIEQVWESVQRKTLEIRALEGTSPLDERRVRALYGCVRADLGLLDFWLRRGRKLALGRIPGPAPPGDALDPQYGPPGGAQGGAIGPVGYGQAVREVLGVLSEIA